MTFPDCLTFIYLLIQGQGTDTDNQSQIHGSGRDQTAAHEAQTT